MFRCRDDYTSDVAYEQQEYTVILGDLIRSRRQKRRQQFAKELSVVLGRVRKHFSPQIYAPLVQTQGIDTLSGVLKQPQVSYRVCREINEQLLPNAFRFAIVQGRLDVGLRSRDASRIDGPAFHAAADLIERAKNEGHHYVFNLGRFAESDRVLTALANLVHVSRARWTKRQRDIIDLYRKLGNQNATGAKLGITQQAVSDALSKASYKEVAHAEEVIESILGAIPDKSSAL